MLNISENSSNLISRPLTQRSEATLHSPKKTIKVLQMVTYFNNIFSLKNALLIPSKNIKITETKLAIRVSDKYLKQNSMNYCITREIPLDHIDKIDTLLQLKSRHIPINKEIETSIKTLAAKLFSTTDSREEEGISGVHYNTVEIDNQGRFQDAIEIHFRALKLTVSSRGWAARSETMATTKEAEQEMKKYTIECRNGTKTFNKNNLTNIKNTTNLSSRNSTKASFEIVNKINALVSLIEMRSSINRAISTQIDLIFPIYPPNVT